MMKKNNSIENRFESFTDQKFSEDENQIIILKNAIQEGINSKRFENFDSLKNLEDLKIRKNKDISP
jgi:hypothetical protein